MIEIYLQDKLDHYHLLKDLKNGLRTFIKNGVIELSLASDRLMIIIDENFNFDEIIKPVIAEILKKHVIESKEEIWLLDIIDNIFFYDDREEQTEILAMAKSILSGERLDLPNVTKLFLTEQLIYSAFMDYLTRDSKFCYESFLTFRLKGYFDKLIDCVEMSIDEYQLEQEYQNLVESFRYYLKSRSPELTCVHLVIDEDYFFYDEFFQLISGEKLASYLDMEIIFEIGVPTEEMVISPLVSIAPMEIHLYCDEIDNTVIHSIQNIFQERVKLYNKEEFQVISSSLT
ncbi:putative sporulation protein YtxC [Bacillaceae bacterium IKA-2]|nr:putative sporulation protein YtxC [Bacillaceae bacterium IKA-2]